MTTFEVWTLILGLYVLFEVFAIPIGTSVGKRIGVFRRLVVTVAVVALGVMSFLLLTGRA